MDEELPVGQGHDAFAEDGGLVDPGLRVALADLVAQLLRDVRAPAEQPA